MTEEFYCPQCHTLYRRADFGHDETYFECDRCAVELVASAAPPYSPQKIGPSDDSGSRRDEAAAKAAKLAGAMRWFGLIGGAAGVLHWYAGKPGGQLIGLLGAIALIAAIVDVVRRGRAEG